MKYRDHGISERLSFSVEKARSSGSECARRWPQGTSIVVADELGKSLGNRPVDAALAMVTIGRTSELERKACVLHQSGVHIVKRFHLPWFRSCGPPKT